MSILREPSGGFMPHFISRRSSGPLSSANAEVVHDLDGDQSAVIYLDASGTFNATYVVEGSANSTDFFPLLCYPYAPVSVGSSLPQPAQPLFTEAANAAQVDRMLCCAVGQLRKMRIRLSAYAGGTAVVTINSDDCPSISPYVRDQKAATLMVTATAAAAAAVTATLPAVSGLRHYLDRVSVLRFATAALTPAAAPVLISTANLPSNPTLTFPADAAAQGSVYEQVVDFGGAGLAAAQPGNTTITCPATTGVIWRVNVAYRLGL